MPLTIEEVRSILQPSGSQSTSMKIGEQYLFRTVTVYVTGRIVAITDTDILIADGAWIPDTGRFSDAVKAVQFNEVEPYPDGEHILFRGGLIDAVRLKGSLPRSQK